MYDTTHTVCGTVDSTLTSGRQQDTEDGDDDFLFKLVGTRRWVGGRSLCRQFDGVESDLG